MDSSHTPRDTNWANHSVVTVGVSLVPNIYYIGSTMNTSSRCIAPCYQHSQPRWLRSTMLAGLLIIHLTVVLFISQWMALQSKYERRQCSRILLESGIIDIVRANSVLTSWGSNNRLTPSLQIPHPDNQILADAFMPKYSERLRLTLWAACVVSVFGSTLFLVQYPKRRCPCCCSPCPSQKPHPDRDKSQ
jgi:hypothetical protein